MSSHAAAPSANGKRCRRAAAAVLAVGGTITLGCAGLAPASSDAAASGPRAASAARQILVTLKPQPVWRVQRAGSTPRSYDGRYRTSAATRRVVSSLADDYGLREVSDWPISALGVHCVVFEVTPPAAPHEILARLAEDARVESAQPMQLFRTQGHGARHNDPYRDLQHGVTAMQVEEAHRWAEGDGVEIAIVDTGVDVAHPELYSRVVLTRDFVDAARAALPPDAHGTAVAGVIASTAGNGIGIVGVAPRARLLVLRACWPEAPGAAQGVCNSFTLAKALSFAIERRPRILNLSLGGPADPLLERLVVAALGRGILVVAAAGASETLAFPGGVAGVLTVQAAPLALAGRLAADAPAGIASPDQALLAAPGVDILTTAPHGAFDFVSGSSIAAAHVSGVAALLLERRPNLRPNELRALLTEGARRAGASDAGAPAMLNACTALAKVVPGVVCPAPANRV